MSRQMNEPAQPGDLASAEAPPLPHWLISLGLLAALTLMMFADVLFTAAPIVLSNRANDLFSEYSHWRAFGFSELKRGNLALWNPCLFCGAPFFGGAQAALLYPLNALFLFLPLPQAINWSIALHVFLAGAFTYAWAARRRLRPPSCFLSAVIYMFAGANFLHVYSGYLSFLCGLVWAPLLFLAIDGLLETPSLGWSLLGMFAVAMQVLAGNPQSLFYTAVAAAIYCALCVFQVRARRPFLLGLAGILLGGAALSAIQLFAGYQEWGEMLRSSGVPFQFAAMFSFPPENFLTLLAPHLFGDIKTVSYWGRCYLWEMSLFISVTGLILGTVGALWGDARARRFSVVMVALMLVLALGAYTPLFSLLYAWVPGFNKFRGNSKFIFLATLFLALLAGLGFDALVRGRRLPQPFLGAMAVITLLLLGGAVTAWPWGPSGPTVRLWQSILLAVESTGESYLPAYAYHSPAFAFGAVRLAAQGLFIAGGTIALVTLLLWCLRRWRAALGLLLALAVVELFVFARLSVDHFGLEEAVDPAIKGFLEQHPGDYRIANLEYPNTALSLRAQDVWGYEPGVVLRYAQLLAVARGLRPDEADFLPGVDDVFSPEHPLLTQLRCRFLFTRQAGHLAIYERTNYLPHLLLVQRCRVLRDQGQIFSALTNSAFNPAQEVILETPPDPLPVVTSDAGTVRLTDSSTDYLNIQADLRSPAILLIPDVYAKGWRARGLPGSSQSRYRVQPGNWCFRAIPLAAGHHRLCVEYAPLGFRLGRWVSLASLPVFLILVALTLFRFVRREGRERVCTWLRLRPKAENAALDGPGGERKGDWPFAEDDRALLALLVSLAAAGLLVFWPIAGRNFLSYGDTVVPVIGLVVGLAWGAQKLATHWRHHLGRRIALGLTLLALIVGVAHREVGYWREARAASNRSSAAAPGNSSSLDRVGEALLKEGLWNEAIGHFQALLKANSALPAVHQSLAATLLREGRQEEAIAHLRNAVQLNPKLASAHSSLANLLLQGARFEEAIAHFQAAIQAQPTNAFYLNNLAWVLATCPQDSVRDGARAVELAQQAERLSGSRNPSILGTLAAAYAEARRLPQAVTTAQRALELATAQTNSAQLESVRSQIKSYQAGSPFRDASQTHATPRLR
jgi:tetratricopeptide (TPR) repeat protein